MLATATCIVRCNLFLTRGRSLSLSLSPFCVCDLRLMGGDSSESLTVQITMRTVTR